MKEELFVSGRNIPNIDPVLHVWHWHIPLYLFLGGLAAGLIFFATYFYVSGKTDKYPTAVKIAPVIAPFAIAIGLIALILDLKHTPYFWRLFTAFRLESPMSWGAWTLGVIMPLSIVWPLIYIKDMIKYFQFGSPRITAILKWIDNLLENVSILKWAMDLARKYQMAIAWALFFMSIILGVYTGILLSAFNARPLWNTSILGPLFLVSGLSTGAAAVMWMSRHHFEQKQFSRFDLMLVGIEIFLIIHMFMGFNASTQVQQQAAAMFLGGEFTAVFWGVFFTAGLVVPALLEIMELFGYKVPVFIPAFLILLGGLIFRFIMVDAGQITRYLY
ncbi:MAG: polysulfide reductase NrfD [Chlorobi bacterium]|nr:polysulfide reductase NrfD [Chlorobiota bacterium]